jgi:hypothetical protein
MIQAFREVFDGDLGEPVESHARQVLSRCHQIMAKETRSEAVQLVAAVSVIEEFMRQGLQNSVNIRHYYAVAYAPTVGPFKASSERNHHRLADALIKLANKLVQEGY